MEMDVIGLSIINIEKEDDFFIVNLFFGFVSI